MKRDIPIFLKKAAAWGIYIKGAMEVTTVS